MPQRAAELREAIARVLGAEVMSRDAIVLALAATNIDLPSDAAKRAQVVRRHLQLDSVFAELSGGIVHVPSQIGGTTWTVWVDADDAKNGYVRMHPHLSPLGWWLIDEDVQLVDSSGASLGTMETEGLMIDGRDTDVVIGPDGWLDGLAGGWASVAVLDGALRVSRCSAPPDPTAEQLAAVRAGFESAVRAWRAKADELHGDAAGAGLDSTSVDDVILEGLMVDRDAFLGAPVPPLPDLFRAAGLEERDAIVAAKGFDWDGFDKVRHLNRLKLQYGFDDAQAGEFVHLVGACRQVGDGDVDVLGGDDAERKKAAALFAAILDDSMTAEAFWNERWRDGDLVVAFKRFVDELETRLGGITTPGLALVRARDLDLGGDIEEAVLTLDRAVSADCAHAAALIELAGYTADRGDAGRAWALLQRAGVPATPSDEDDDAGEYAEMLVEEVAEFARHRPRPAAKRNDPCPCGSGRKYKACHLGREEHSLDERAGWLYLKAQRFLRQRGEQQDHYLARHMAEAAGSPQLHDQMCGSPFALDLALHEGEMFAEFLAAREALLPGDEARLAAHWEAVDRGAFEVQRTGSNWLELHDIGRDTQVTVVNVHPSTLARRSAVVVGRPLPVGDTYRAFSGFIPVPHHAVRDLLDAIDEVDPFAIAAAIGAGLRPADAHDDEVAAGETGPMNADRPRAATALDLEG